jgi:hypothetical protein
MKKLSLCLFIFIFSPTVAYSQYSGYEMQNIGIGLQGILSNNYASSPMQGQMYGQAANMNAYGNYVYNQSLANINNQIAYSMSLDNQTQRARVFFEKRQINRYYRDMEGWQREERARLKRSDLYDKAAIEYLYDIRKP